VARPSQSAPTSPRAAAPLPNIASGASAAQAPKVARKPPFWLAFLPERWTVLDGRVLPSLQEFTLEHGCNGCEEVLRDDGTGRQVRVLVVDDARANLHAKGGREIPWDIDDEPYLYEAWPDHWVTRWTRLTPGTSHLQVDLEGYADFLERLTERGVLPRPQARHLDRLAAALRLDIEESSKHSSVQPHRVAQLQAQLEVVDRELASMLSEQAEADDLASDRVAERRPGRGKRASRKLPTVQFSGEDYAEGEGGEA
jgi:hypothetical protein